MKKELPAQTKTHNTLVVAASDSLNKGAANFICPGADDQLTIQAAIDALPCAPAKAPAGKVLLHLSIGREGSTIIVKCPDHKLQLLEGNFYISPVYDMEID